MVHRFKVGIAAFFFAALPTFAQAGFKDRMEEDIPPAARSGIVLIDVPSSPASRVFEDALRARTVIRPGRRARPAAAAPPPSADRVSEEVAGATAASLGQGVATWYGPGFHGRRTANGERFDRHAMTAAHRSLPFGSMVRVFAESSGRSVVVRINDRGPHRRGAVIDLSEGSARALGIGGTARVRLVAASG